MAEILEIEVRAKGAKETANELDKIAESIKKISDSNGIGSLTPKIKSATKEANKFSNVLSGKLLKSLERIAFYRLMRTIVKSITDALKEGLKNAYLFSKSINSGLAQALDSLSSKSLTLKNSLGAAFGELIQTITPMLISLMNFAIKVANVISQLFAILGGRSTWLKATESTAKYADEAKNAAGATKEWKNQLMGFDEINKLEDQSGGGSGSGTNIGNWDSQLAPVNEKLKYIWDLVKAIGLGLLGWKVAKAFGGSLQKCIGWALTLGGAFLTINGYLDMWKNGISAESLTETMIGIGLLAVGLTLAFGQTAGAIALLVGGIALVVIGIKEWIQTGKLSVESFVAIATGILLVGAAISLLIGGGGWIPLLIAGITVAVVGIVALITNNWNAIKEWTISTWENIKTTITTKFEEIVSNLTKFASNVKTRVVSLWSDVKSKVTSGASAVKSTIQSLINWIPNTISNICSQILSSISNTISNIISYVSSGIRWIKRLMSLGSSSSSSDFISTGERISLGKFASGGTPATGSLFIAGESGAELVSSVGGRTNVSNTDQIANSVSVGNEGVVSAVYAMANAIVKTIDNKDMDVSLDGMSLARKMYKYNSKVTNEHGMSLINA